MNSYLTKYVNKHNIKDYSIKFKVKGFVKKILFSMQSILKYNQSLFYLCDFVLDFCSSFVTSYFRSILQKQNEEVYE